MTKAEYLAYHRAMCDRMIEITQAKNADYTGDSPSPFANFTTVERLGIATTLQGFLVRMTDKFMRVISFMQRGILEVKEESVEDALLDLANYSILLAAFIKANRAPKE